VFAELLTCSNFSFLLGASHPEEFVEQAHQLGLSALGLCDREGLYGAVRGYARAKELGQRYLVGAELSLDLTEYDNENDGSTTAQATEHNRKHPEHTPTLVFYPEHQRGYRSLCHAITQAHQGRTKGTSGYRLHQLGVPTDGVVFIVPADSLLILEASACPFNDLEPLPLDRVLLRLAQDAPKNTYLGLFRHFDTFDSAREDLVRSAHEQYGFPIIASARPRFHRRERRPLADVIDCIRRGTTLDEAGTQLYANSEALLLSEAEMLSRFSDRPDWVHRTQEIVERCQFDLGKLEYRFPCHLEPQQTADEKLREQVKIGARRRYPEGVPERVKLQLKHELDIIASLQMASYFLSTWEIVQLARHRQILCQGRGSAANSAVCFVLGITAVDPSRSRMLFERFMSPERQEPPDIDIDFEHERREEIIQDIYTQYGRDKAAMVAEVIRYRGRSALREVAKVFGLSPEQIDRLTSLVSGWDNLGWLFDESAPCTLSVLARERLLMVGLDASDTRLLQALRLARELQGFPRHLSIHVGGFVLSAEPLETVCPIEPGRMPGRTVVPWDKDDIDTLGFFKVDVLALGMLTAIRRTLESLHHDGLHVAETTAFSPLESLARIPPEDPTVYHTVAHADTIGIFQIESRAQMAMLPRLRPKCFYDLVIEVAIMRPGPIHGGMVHPYLRRRDGLEAVSYAHPALAEILQRTLGVPLFQEQVMQVAIVGAGYTGGEADQLRRDMAAWHKNSRLLLHRERLLSGFRRNGISDRFSEALFEQIKGFGEYGFPESHAASFALLVYASAWLKTHYPAHFVVALLNSQPMGFYSPHSLVRDAIAHHVIVRDVDVASSHWDVTLEGPVNHREVRLGFRLVKGLSRTLIKQLVEERAYRPFKDLDDFRLRLCPAKDQLAILAETGAFQSLGVSRRSALWAARRPAITPLFVAAENQPQWNHVKLPKLSAKSTMSFDFATKSLSLNSHPLEHLRKQLAAKGVVTANQLPRYNKGQTLTVAGLVLCRQQPATASGLLFVTLEDETGVINLIIRPAVHAKYERIIHQSSLLLAWGKLERTCPSREKTVPVIHLMTQGFVPLDRGAQELTRMSRDFR
jgi:error-prone DNA polymerase